MINLFQVGVHIGMTSNASQVLSTMLQHLTGVHLAANKVEGALGAIQKAALGAGAVFVGWTALKAMTHLLEKGIAFNQELAKMKMANIPQGDIDRLENQSYSTMENVPGSNLVDNIKRTADLRNISGSTGHVEFLSDLAAKTDLVLSNVTGKPAEQSGFKFAKFLEDSGRTTDPKTGQFSEERIARQYHWMQAVIAQERGKVSGDDMFQFRQSGKASVNALSDEGLTNAVPAIYSLGPVAAGTGIQAMTQQLLGSVQLYKHTIDWLEQYHLVDPRKVIKQKGGHYSLAPGAITGEKQLQTDKIGWIWDVMSPNMKHKDGSAMTAQEKVAEILRSGLRTPMQGLISETIQNEGPQRKDISFLKNAQKIDTFKKMDEESPAFRVTKFTEAWANLQTALGKTVDVTKILVPLTDALNAMNAAAVKHPDAARALIFLAGGVAALTTVGAGLVLLNTCWAPLAAGLRLLAGVSGLAAAGTAVGAVGTALSGLALALAPFAAGAAAYVAFTNLPGLLKSLADWALGDSLRGATAAGGRGSVHATPDGTVFASPNMANLPRAPAEPPIEVVPGTARGGGRGSVHGSPSVIPPPQAGDGGRGSTRGPSPYVPPATTAKPERQSLILNVDGKRLASLVMDHAANSFSRPPTGPMGADVRVSPVMPGLASAFG